MWFLGAFRVTAGYSRCVRLVVGTYGVISRAPGSLLLSWILGGLFLSGRAALSGGAGGAGGPSVVLSMLLEMCGPFSLSSIVHCSHPFALALLSLLIRLDQLVPPSPSYWHPGTPPSTFPLAGNQVDLLSGHRAPLGVTGLKIL